MNLRFIRDRNPDARLGPANKRIEDGKKIWKNFLERDLRQPGRAQHGGPASAVRLKGNWADQHRLAPVQDTARDRLTAHPSAPTHGDVRSRCQHPVHPDAGVGGPPSPEPDNVAP